MVIPKMLFDLQGAIVAIVLQDLPDGLDLHLLDVPLHEHLKVLEVDALDILSSVKVIADHNLLQSSYVSFMELLIKDFFLHVDKVLIIHSQVSILVTDSEDPKQGSLEVLLQGLGEGVVERLDWKEESPLRGGKDIDEVQVHLGRALNCQLDLLKRLDVVQKVLELRLVLIPPSQVDLVAHEDHRRLLVELDDPRHPVRLESLLALLIVDIVDHNEHVCLLD